MGATSVDLFRSGNATSARLAHVRIKIADPDVDIDIDASGDVWVLANGKGVSTWDSADPGWSGKPWRLPAGSAYSDQLVVWCDSPGHWVWEPTNMVTIVWEESDLAKAARELTATVRVTLPEDAKFDEQTEILRFAVILA
jgi:hypothetical protein